MQRHRPRSLTGAVAILGCANVNGEVEVIHVWKPVDYDKAREWADSSSGTLQYLYPGPATIIV